MPKAIKLPPTVVSSVVAEYFVPRHDVESVARAMGLMPEYLTRAMEPGEPKVYWITSNHLERAIEVLLPDYVAKLKSAIRDVRKLREDCGGRTQQELANLLQISATTICYWERAAAAGGSRAPMCLPLLVRAAVRADPAGAVKVDPFSPYAREAAQLNAWLARVSVSFDALVAATQLSSARAAAIADGRDFLTPGERALAMLVLGKHPKLMVVPKPDAA